MKCTFIPPHRSDVRRTNFDPGGDTYGRGNRMRHSTYKKSWLSTFLTVSAFFLLGLTSVTAQTSTWTGAAGNGFWDDPNNYSPVGLPVATSTVIIPGGATPYPSGYNSMVSMAFRRLDVQNGASATVPNLFTLTLNATASPYGISLGSGSSVTNNHNINIGAAATGIRNQGGTFINNDELYINGATAAGISNSPTGGATSPSVFINNSEITIGNISSGGANGIFNGGAGALAASFTNANGMISILNVDNAGIRNSALNGPASFINQADIAINANNTLSGFDNEGFINEDNGTTNNTGNLSVDNANRAIVNRMNGTFTNDTGGSIVINPMAPADVNNGIVNILNGTFVNRSAAITMTSLNQIGIWNGAVSSAATFLNTGTGASISINGTAQYAIRNLSDALSVPSTTFKNEDSAVITICDGGVGASTAAIYNGVNASFTNGNSTAGSGALLNVVSAGADGIYNAGTFLNTSYSSVAPFNLSDISVINIGFTNGSCTGNIPGNGITNMNAFTNTEDSRINITAFALSGIENFGTFNNTNPTNSDINYRNEIIITGTSGIAGIFNRNNLAVFTNSDYESFIHIDGVLGTGIINQNTAQLNNFNMSRIEIQSPGIITGFVQNQSAVFNQNGYSSTDIELTGGGITGFLNDDDGVINNFGASSLSIIGASSIGLRNTNNAVINNGSAVSGLGNIFVMGTPMGVAVQNDNGASIYNIECSVVYTNDKINNESTFINDAIIKTTFTGTNMATVPIVNNGIIIDYENSFNNNLVTRTNDPTLVDNSVGVIAPPVKVCPPDPATGSMAMAKKVLIANGPITGKTFQTSVAWYDNPGLVPPGSASYDPTNNTLTFNPNPIIGSTFDMYYDVDGEGTGCQFNGLAKVTVDSLAAIKGTFTKLDFTGNPMGPATMVTAAMNNPAETTICSGMGVRIAGENLGALTDINGNPLWVEVVVNDPSGITIFPPVNNFPASLLPASGDLFPMLNSSSATADVSFTFTPYFEADGIPGRDTTTECSGATLALTIHVIPDPINFVTISNTSVNAQGNNDQTRRVCSMSDFEFNGTVSAFPSGVTGFKLNWKLTTITGPAGAFPFNDGQVNVQSDCGPLGMGTMGSSETVLAPGNIVFDGSDANTPCSAPVMNLSDLAPHERRVFYELTPTFILADGTECPSGSTPIEVRVVVYPKPQIELDNQDAPVNDDVNNQGDPIVICDNDSPNGKIQVRQFPTQVVEQPNPSPNDEGDLEYDVNIVAPAGITPGAYNPALLSNVGSDGVSITKLGFVSPVVGLPNFDNTTMMPQIVTIEVTPAFDPDHVNAAGLPDNTDPDGSCFGTTRSIPVTVMPTPDLDPTLFTDLLNRVIDVTICGSDGMDAAELTQVLNMKNMNMAPFVVEFELYDIDLTNAPDVTRSTMATGSPNGGHPNTTDNTFGYEVLSGNNFTEYLMNNGVLTQTVVYTFRPQIDFMSGAETEICYGPTFEIRVQVLPKVFNSATPDGSNLVCQSATRLVEGVPGSFPAHPGPWTHEWVVASPQPAGFTGTGEFVDVNALPGGQSTTSQTGEFKGINTGMIRLLYYATPANGCAPFQPFVLDLEVIPQPALNPIGGPNMVCPGANATYAVSVDNSPANTYSWTLSSGGTFSTPTNGPSVGINWSTVLGGPHTLTATETSPNGCETVNTYIINIVDMSDPTTMCPADITVGTSTDGDRGDCEYEVIGTFLDVIASDNCGIMSATHDYDFGGTSLHHKIFDLGTTTVTWTVKDNSGSTNTCTFNITVVDDEFPSVLCPHDVSVNTDGTGLDIFSQLAGVTTNTSPDCGIILSNLAPTTTDNCNTIDVTWTATGSTPDNGSGALSNVEFNVGNTTVTFSADDTHGNVSTCSFNVQVVDNEKPAFTCPSNTILYTSDDAIANNCAYLVGDNTLDASAANDNCGVLSVVNNYNGTATLNGSTLPFGPTTIVWTITDVNGNQNSCTYTLDVKDNEGPIVATCPSDITVTTNGNECDGFVSYELPRFNDNCGGVNQLGTLASGLAPDTDFPKGVTTVVYNYFDPSGNGPATCSFKVTVIDNQKPSISCPPNIIVNNDGSGLNYQAFTYGITVDDTGNDCSVGFLGLNPVMSDNCPGPYTLSHEITYPDGTTVASPGSVNAIMFPVGVSTVAYIVRDQSNNTSSCTFTITVKDVEKPVFAQCASDVTISTSVNGTGDCAITIPELTAGVALIDNCSSVLNITVTQSPAAGTIFAGSHGSVQVVTLTATDQSGNTATCTAKVTIRDDENPVAQCATPYELYLDQSGNASIAVADINNGSFDNCHINNLAINTTQVSCAEAGNTVMVTLTVTDDAGNLATCTTPVMVLDTLAPVIKNCPSNIVQGNDPDMCMAFVNFSKVQSTDNCDNDVDIYYWTSGATVLGGPDIFGQSGDADPSNDPILGQANAKNYNVGITTVHYFAVDNFGNISEECTFTIDVRDAQKPVITKCPDNRDIFVNAGTCSGTVPNMIPELIYKDNCAVTVTQSPVAGTLFGNAHNDTQVVTFTVTDAGGNTATCTTVLTLKDNIAPIITTCPPSRNVGTVLNTCSGVVPNMIPELIYTENCPNVTVTQTPVAGTSFGAANNDTQVVTFTVTDAAGNTATCTAVLTLKDTQAPTIICPPNVNVPCTISKITIPKPVTSDNCGVASVTNSKNGTDDASDIYAPGTTTVVVWTVTDVNGNQATCSMTVTVAPVPTLTVTGAGSYCKDGFIPDAVATSSTTGTFSWYKNAALTIPVNPAQVSGPNNNTYHPTGILGTETVYVVITDPVSGCVSNPVSVTYNIVACSVTSTDPCHCKNNATTLTNGQFDEEITIFAPSGQTWHIVTATGLYKTSSPAPPAAPIPVTTGVGSPDKPIAVAPGVYRMNGIHVDGLGYNITFANGLGDTLTLSNLCYYPNPQFVGLNPDYCANHPVVQLQGTAAPSVALNERFDLYDATNTIAVQLNITQLNPALLAPGTYTVRYTFTAQPNTPNTQYAGCEQTITMQVKIFPVPPVELACGSLHNVSLDPSGIATITSDVVLEGNYGCWSQYQVSIEGKTNNIVTCADLGKTFKVSIIDPFTGNKCWGNILVEDKLAPTITCADVTVSCNNDGLDPSLVGYPVFKDNCGVDPATITYNETINNPTCTGDFSAVITRTWFARDYYGNSATPCTQTISVKRGTLAEVVFPPNLDDKDAPSISCVNPNTNPAVTGVPTIDGKPINKFCELMVAPPQDVVIPICDNSYKIVRTWTVMDACSNNMITGIQVIIVKDKEGPSLTCPKPSEFNYTVSGNGNKCLAIIQAPKINVQDNCSQAKNVNVKTKVTVNGIVTELNSNGGIFQIPFGIYTFTYTATDACGNITSCSVDVDIKENEPPVAVCQELTVVSLINPVTLVNATSFDSGSYDECGGALKYTVRRMDNPACPGTDATTFADKVPFYCCDVNNGPVTVVMRVTDASGNYNECMVQVTVVDKIKPAVLCPSDISVQCGQPYTPEDPAVISFDKKVDKTITINFPVTLEEKIVVSGLPPYATIEDINLGLDIKHDYIDQLTLKLISPAGTVVTLFQGGSCGAFTTDINATFDDEGAPFFCNGNPTAIVGNVQSQYNALSYFDGENPNGIWTVQVIDGAPLGGGTFNSAKLTISYNTPLSLKPIVTDNASDCGVNLTWVDANSPGQCQNNVTITRRWIATDKSGNTGFCDQKVKLIDTTPLDILFPADVTITECKKFEDLAGLKSISHNGDCELVAVEYIDEIFDVVPDACYKIIRTWKVLDWCKYNPSANNTEGGIVLNNNPRHLRDDGDGYFIVKQVIKVIDNEKPHFYSCPKDTVICSMAEDCNNNPVSITKLAYDGCAKPDQLKYEWKLDITANGTYDISGSTPTMNVSVPLGKHRVWFKVTDGCGNYDICDFTFTVNDCKKPTPVCHKGLSTDIMVTGMVAIPAKAFNASSSDNCTAPGKLKFSYSTDVNDTTVVYTCDSLGMRVVRMWVTDEAGNQDYCETFIMISDNMNVCGDTMDMIIVSGDISTMQGKMVSDVNVNLAGSNMPPYNTNDNGKFKFPAMKKGSSYTVVPKKDVNPLNGVNTLDLVLITNHILGKKQLDSPYKMIAADANKSGNVTTADLLEIRKLILHVKQNYSNNDSWRFVDKKYVFPVPTNPWSQPFPEVCNLQNMQSPMKVEFIGIKIGDVTGDALPNAAVATETRNAAGTLNFIADDADLTNGESYTMVVKSKDFINTIGYQYTLNFDTDKLEFADIQPLDLDGLHAENFGLSYVDKGLITTSWNGPSTSIADDTKLFAITFKVLKNTRLSNSVATSSDLTPAEAYNKATETFDIGLQFVKDNEPGEYDFRLLQNNPNPFGDVTNISFYLPQDEYAQLVITNVEGKVVKMIEGDFNKGLNQIKLHKAEIGAGGIYYYQLNTATESKTMKMIIIE